MADQSAMRSRLTSSRIIVVAAIVLGVGARALSLLATPQNSYLPDHKDAMAWSGFAAEHGPLSLYDMPAPRPIVVWIRNPATGQVGPAWSVAPHAYNYPPLSAIGFWAQGLIWSGLDDSLISPEDPRAHAERLARFGVRPSEPSRAIWTLAAQFAASAPPMLCDFLLAWGVMALVRGIRRRPDPLREAIAFAITLLAPPIFLDSAFWNQYDVWIACPLVWCVAFLVRERFLWAGVFYGLSIVIKPSAILLGPVFIYVFASLRLMPGGSWSRMLGPVKMGVVALVVAILIASPFMVHDARDAANPDGAFRWFKRSYLGTIGDERYARTTLSAFNIWWFDLVSHGKPTSGQEMQRFWKSDEPMLGVSKALLGKSLLAIGVVLAWVLCGRKWRWAPESWPVCAFVILLAAFTLPTSVHERYIYYCIPFCIALAVHERKWIAPLIALLIVGTFEMTSFRWATYPRGLYSDPSSPALSFSVFLAVLTTLSLLYSYAVLIPRKRA